MGKLTQQKYDLTCALMKAGLEIHSGNEHLLFAAVDAYADAREKEKDAEIERLKHAVKLWESLRDDAIDANSQLQVHNQRILDYAKSIRSKIQHGTATLYEIATIVESAIINQ